MPRRTLLGVALPALIAVACGGQWLDTTQAPTSAPSTTEMPADPVAESASFDVGPCPIKIGAAWSERVTCGRLTVAMTRADPESATIELAVAIIAAETDVPAPDPVVYLHGGPGGAAVFEAEAWLDPRSPLLDDRDIVLVDQRGSGFSTPSLDCPEFDELGPGSADRACRSRLVAAGVDLGSFTTADTVRDLADLRRALGYESWNLYGVSYGSRVALTALRDAPDGIRSVVLDSAYPPVVDAYDTEAINARDAIVGLLATCQADTACDSSYPDIENRLVALIERLDRSPMAATISDDDGDYEVVVDGAIFADALFVAMYDPYTMQVVPAAIDAAESGDLGLALDWLGDLGYQATPRQVDDETTPDDSSEGAQYMIECAEEVPFNSLGRAVELADDDTLAQALLLDPRETHEACAIWSVPPSPPIEDLPIDSDVPTLILGGQFDPITPPDWGRIAAQTLSRSTVVEIPAEGHVPSFTNTCAEGLVAAFVADPNGAVDASCVDELPPIVDFVVD